MNIYPVDRSFLSFAICEKPRADIAFLPNGIWRDAIAVVVYVAVFELSGDRYEIKQIQGSVVNRIVQYIPRNMHTVLLCFALLWLCNRS